MNSNHNWRCRNDINCGATTDEVSEHDGELCQECYEDKEEYEAYVARLVAENKRLQIGNARYETLRKLNVGQFADLYAQNISTGTSFDELVDRLGVRHERISGTRSGRRRSPRVGR